MFRAITPFRLGELMQQFRVDRFTSATAFLESIKLPRTGGILRSVQVRIGESDAPSAPVALPMQEEEPFTAEDRAAFKGYLEKVWDECRTLRLKACLSTIQKMNMVLDDPKLPFSELQHYAPELQSRVMDELRQLLCFAIEGSDETLFEQPHQFGEQVSDRFPSAVLDIEEAAKCLALDRGTACVFHLMRVLEVGLRALAKSLNDPRLDPKTNPTWDNILKKCDAELQKPLADRSLEWRTDEQFFSEATANLRAVKNAWRNPTMHIEIRYAKEQATDVWNAAKGFMRHLATKLHE